MSSLHFPSGGCLYALTHSEFERMTWSPWSGLWLLSKFTYEEYCTRVQSLSHHTTRLDLRIVGSIGTFCTWKCRSVVRALPMVMTSVFLLPPLLRGVGIGFWTFADFCWYLFFSLLICCSVPVAFPLLLYGIVSLEFSDFSHSHSQRMYASKSPSCPASPYESFLNSFSSCLPLFEMISKTPSQWLLCGTTFWR